MRELEEMTCTAFLDVGFRLQQQPGGFLWKIPIFRLGFGSLKVDLM
jgi:hypothetical protein